MPLANLPRSPLDRRMSIWGLIIGGAAGFALGGPIGALLGAVAGHAVSNKLAPANADPDATRKVAFTVAVIALSAKMAKADGVVTRDEIAAFRNRVHIPPSELKQVGRFWDLARQTPDGFEDYAKQVVRLFTPRASVLEQLLDLLFHIAKSDGEITPPEMEYLSQVAHIFGFDTAAFDRLKALHQPGTSSPYEVLGVAADIDDKSLRHQWKKLVRAHHPDTLIAEGMPEEFVLAANDRLAAINAAYDHIRRQRDL